MDIINTKDQSKSTQKKKNKVTIDNPLMISEISRPRTLRSTGKIQTSPKIVLVPIKKLQISPDLYDEERITPEIVYPPSESEDDENSWWLKYQIKEDENWQVHEEEEVAAKESRKRLDQSKKQRKKIKSRSGNFTRVACNECGKTFVKNDVLKIHMRTHSDHKPYNCKICHKQFTRRTHLKQHALIHSGCSPYVCNAIVDGFICGKAFSQKPGLIGHRKSHSGTLPPLPRVSIDEILQGIVYE